MANVAICSRRLDAQDLAEFLNDNEVDARVLSRHAVQCPDEQAVRAHELKPRYSEWLARENALIRKVESNG